MTRPSASRRHDLLTRSALCGVLGALAVGTATPALAVNWGNATVAGSTGGTATGGTAGSVTTVNVTGSRTVIDWSSFNLTDSETINFQFSNRDNIVLNRITGVATIDGILNGCVGICSGANYGGSVWLYSANGVIFGLNAQVNVGNLLATTASLDRALDSTSGGFLDPTSTSFSFTGGAGFVSIESTNPINARGSLAFIAPIVSQLGGSTVASADSDVLYGAAVSYTIQFAPDAAGDMDLVSFNVPAAASGTSNTVGVSLDGATTGNRVFAAVVSKTAVASRILLAGTIQATAVSGVGGDIVLSAGGGIDAGGVAGAAIGGVDQIVITGGTALASTGGDISIKSSGDTTWTTTGSQSLIASQVTIEAGGAASLSTANGSIVLNSVSALGDVSVDGGGVGSTTSVTSASSTNGSVTVQSALTSSLTTGSAGLDIIVSGTTASLNNGTAGRDIFVAGTTGGAAVVTSAIAGDDIEITATSGAISSGGATLRSTGSGADDGHVLAWSTGSSVSVGSATTQGVGATAGDIIIQALSTATLGSGSSSRDLTVSGATANLTTGDASRDLTVTASSGVATVTASATAGDDVTINGAAGVLATNATLTATGVGGADAANVSVTSVNGAMSVGHARTLGTGATVGDVTLQAETNMGFTSITSSRNASVNSVSGSITQASASGVITATNLVASGSVVNLNGVNQVTNLRGTSGGLFSFRDADGVNFNGSVTATTLTLNIGGALTQGSGALNVTTLNVEAVTGITLNGPNNIINLGVVGNATSGGISVANAGALNLAGNLTALNQTISLGASGTLSQSAGIIRGGTLNASASGITLTGANQVTSLGVLTASTGNIAYTDSDTIDLTGNVTTTTAGRTVSISSTAGAITQSGGIINTGTLSASAVTGITLNRANTLTSVGALSNTTSGGIGITDASDLDLTGNISAAGQTVTVSATTGRILQTGSSITAGTLNASAVTGITISNFSNNVANLGVLTNTGAGAISYTDNNDYTLTGDVTAAAGQTINLQSVNGAISQTGGVITGGTLTTNAWTGVNLNQANQVTNLGLMASGSGSLTYRDVDSFALTGNVSTTNAVFLTSDAGAITQSAGAINAATLNASAVTGIALTRANTFANLGAVTNATSGGIAITHATGLNLGDDVTALGQTISLTSNTGAITQSGGVIQAGSLIADSDGLSLTQANLIDTLTSASVGGALVINNAKALDISGTVNGGAVTIATTAGALTGSGNITATNQITLTGAAGVTTTGSLFGGNTVTVTATAGDALIDSAIANGAVTVQAGAGNATLRAVSLGGASNSVTVSASGTATLGADSVAGITAANFVNRVGGVGSVNVISSGGDARVFLNSVNAALTTVDANNSVGTASIGVASGFTAGTVDGRNVVLTAPNGTINITALTVWGGDYTATFRDFLGSVLNPGGSMNDISITDTLGGLTLSNSLLAGGDLSIDVQNGGTLTTSSLLRAGNGAGVGNLSVTAANLSLGAVDADGNVTLDAGTGVVLASSVSVGGDYTLTGGSFNNGALSPSGARAGTWTLTDTFGDLALSSLNPSYAGDIVVSVVGALTGSGTILSTAGGVTIDAGSILVGFIRAGGGAVDVTSGGNLDVTTVQADGGDVDVDSGGVVTVANLIASNSIGLSAAGNVAVSNARAGDDISLVSNGGALTVQRVEMTGVGAGRDLTLTSAGDLRFGAINAANILGFNLYSRAGAGTTTIRSSTGDVSVNLTSAANLGALEADEDVSVTVQTGDIDLATGQATTGSLSLTAQSGGLLVGGSVTAALDITLSATTINTASASASRDLSVTATAGALFVGEARAGDDITLTAQSGSATLERAVLTGLGADTEADGRNLSLTGGGLTTLGAASEAGITSDNTLTRDPLAAGGAVTVATTMGGDINVFLYSANTALTTLTGPRVTATVATGNLSIGTVTATNATLKTPGLLTVTGGVNLTGDYTVTAADFAGLALTPAAGVDDVTITDTGGGLDVTGIVTAGRNLTVVVQGGTLSAGAFTAGTAGAGDLSITATGITAGVAASRNVTLDAGVGAISVTTASVGGDYNLTGGSFAWNTLTPTGARAGTWTITDTVGNFDSTGALNYVGSIDITALNGRIIVSEANSANGDVTAVGQSVLIYDVSAGDDVTLTATAGSATSLSITAGDDIGIYATGGSATLGSANLTGVGAGHDLVLMATGGDAILGETPAPSIFTRTGTGATTVTSTTGDVRITLSGFNAGALDLTSATAARDIMITNNGFMGSMQIGSLNAQRNVLVNSFLSARIDNVTAGGWADIRGGANATLGNISTQTGLILRGGYIDLTGDILASGQTVDIQATGVTQSGGTITADLLTAQVAESLVLDRANAVGRLGQIGVGSGAAHQLVFRNAGDLELSGDLVAMNGTITLFSGGTITQTGGRIDTRLFSGASVGGATFDSTSNGIEGIGDFTNTGSGALRIRNVSTYGLTISGSVSSAGAVVVQEESNQGLIIAATGQVSSAAQGDAIVLAFKGNITNQRGADALATSDPLGRWLIYVQSPFMPHFPVSEQNFGGLVGKSFYGAAYDFATGSFATTPGAGNRFVYGYRPVLTVTPVTQTVTYNGSIPSISALITGLINGDSAADAWSGSPLLSGNSSKNAGTYNLLAALGSLASEMNYDFDFAPGLLTINPKALTGTVVADDKTYDGTTAATGSVTLSGVIVGDTVGAAGGTYAFADKTAGVGKTVTATGVGLTGGDAGNYTLDPLATAVADILRKSLTGALTASSKTYDGTTSATGAISLTGVVTGDDVAAGGTYAFADENAGADKTVTAGGVALSGADAANYDLTAVSTAIADILRKSLTGTLTASSKTYDGATTATGSVSLNGVIAGDDVVAGGTYAFADKTAGAGKTVTATGVGLTGADAANYDLTAVATAVADILRKTLTGALTASNKTYDGSTQATGSISLTGVIAGDEVSAGGTYAFADRNAGVGKTVTAAGVALTGADAANYDLASVSTAIADILRKALTGTVTAQNKTYDGTTTASGSITLAGVIAGDSVGTTAGAYAFADANAGSGQTVTVSGVSLNGADAGNYVLGALTPGLADILRRAVAIQADHKTKRVGQSDPALTWTLLSGSLAQGDTVSGALARVGGEQVGTYVIGQGSLTLSQNYDLTFRPGAFVIEAQPAAGQDASDALRYLRTPYGFSLYRSPVEGLTVADERDACPDGQTCPQVSQRSLEVGAAP